MDTLKDIKGNRYADADKYLKDAVQFARQIRRGEIAETDVREMARAYRAPKLIEPEDIVVEMF